MTEPWASFGDLGELGLPSALVALHARQEAREEAAERREAEERRERAEDRREALLFQYMQRAVLEGRQVDPNDPATFVPTVEEMADRVFREQDRESARDALKAKLASGELHLLNIPASEMTPPRAEETPEGEALADAWLDRAHQRSQREGIRARIRRALRPRSAPVELEHESREVVR